MIHHCSKSIWRSPSVLADHRSLSRDITTVANSTSGISSPFQSEPKSDIDNSLRFGKEDEGDVRLDRAGLEIGEGIAIRKVIST
jgi:hypothetical protein